MHITTIKLKCRKSVSREKRKRAIYLSIFSMVLSNFYMGNNIETNTVTEESAMW